MGSGRPKSTAELYGPVWRRWLGSVVARRRWAIIQANTGELQAMAEALLRLRDKERGTSPVLFCLDAMNAADPTQGICLGHDSSVLVATGKQLCIDKLQTSDWGLSVTHVPGHCEIPGSERADDELAARGKAGWRRKCRSFRKLWRGLVRLARSPLAARLR